MSITRTPRLVTALVASAALALGSCAIFSKPPADLVPAGPDSAVQRSVDRVADRHDAYVQADEEIAPEDAAAQLAESAQVRSLVELEAVQVDVLAPALRPVLARHDQYVSEDPSLEALERDIYLESSIRLEAILSQAEAGAR